MSRLPLLLAFASAAFAQSASVEGIVVNHATSQPLEGAHIRLFTGDFNNGGMEHAFGAISDKAGHYSVTGMPAGFYIVMLERTGFTPAATAGPAPFATLALKAGQSVTNHKLEMDQRALIKGRVLDAAGDPVQNAEISLQAPPAAHETPPPFFGRMNTGTDDRGEFHITTPPGKYYVCASRDTFEEGVAEVRADGSVPTNSAETCYPGAADTASATLVDAGPGQDVTGIEIHLRVASAPTNTLSISGQVTGIPDGARANVTLRFGENSKSMYSSRAIEVGEDGRFSFLALQPAHYSIAAQYFSGKISLRSQAIDFQLDADRAGLQLNLRPGEELTGTLEMVGGPPQVSVEKRTVTLELRDSMGSGVSESPSAGTDKSGAFRLPNVHFGQFHVSVDPLPENAFIQSISLDGEPIPDSDALDLSRGVGGSRLKITVSLNGAQLSGKIMAHDGDPLTSPLVTVMLWKGEQAIEAEGGNRITSGSYNFKALRPGKYRVVAIDNLELADLGLTDWDDVQKVFKAAAQELELKEGDRIIKDLRVVGKEDLHGREKH